MFLPISKVRNLGGYFQPFDGCPQCGYAFEREPGYFLLATWAINYVVACAIGLLAFSVVSRWPGLSLALTFVLTLLPTLVAALLTIRHSKAIFLAMDLSWDPPDQKKSEESEPTER